MNHMGDRAFPDHHVIQAGIGVNLLSAAPDGHVQHHAPFRRHAVPEFAQSVQFRGLQFGDKAQTAHINAEYRRFVQCRDTRQMQNGAVSAKRHNQRRVPDFRRKGPRGVIRERAARRGSERRTDHRGKAAFA